MARVHGWGLRRLLRRIALRAAGVTSPETPPVVWQLVDPSSGAAFDGQTVVISGAAGRLGRHLVDAVMSQGAVVHAIDRDAEGLQALGARWPGTLTCHVAELTDADDLARVVSTIGAMSTHVDALVHSVGGNDYRSALGELDAGSWHDVLDMNLVAPALLTRALLPLLAARPSPGPRSPGPRSPGPRSPGPRSPGPRSPGVVFITSINGRMSSLWPHYASAKAATAKLVRDLARQLAPLGIRVNAVAPGGLGEIVDARPDPRAPLTRSAVPFEAVVHAVLFLADPLRSACTTGQELAIDAGEELR